LPNRSDDGSEAQQRGFPYAGTFPSIKWPPYIVQAEVGEINNDEAIISAEGRDDQGEGVLSVEAIVYKPSYQPPDTESAEMPQENLPALSLRDLDGDGIYTTLYENFDESGQYRIVINAIDIETLQARPKEVIVQTGGYQLYLPAITR
jgi:hypothetical protein